MLLKKSFSVVFAVVFLFSMISCNEKTKSKQFYGYDNIPWGASPEDVRKAYNLGEEFVLATDKEDSNIGRIILNNASGNIARREFLFNKWNDNNYKLYRVWVFYNDDEKDSQSIVSTLINTLQNIYGPVTHSYEERKTQHMFVSLNTIITTYVIFGTFEPDLEVVLENERTVIDIQISRGFIDRNRVRYTWKKFRDSYEATRLGL